MITLICGPMYSGKSTALLQKMERYKYAKKKVLFIKPVKDTRGYVTHGGVDDVNTDTREVSEWNEQTLKYVDGFDAVFVDEYFMIKNNTELCKYVVDKNIDVFFGGLLATSENKIMQEAQEIAPYCDDIIKLNGVCVECGSQFGNYSLREADKTDEISVGDKEYKCVCMKCYKKIKGRL